jgi:hypothetical protein
LGELQNIVAEGMGSSALWMKTVSSEHLEKIAIRILIPTFNPILLDLSRISVGSTIDSREVLTTSTMASYFLFGRINFPFSLSLDNPFSTKILSGEV